MGGGRWSGTSLPTPGTGAEAGTGAAANVEVKNIGMHIGGGPNDDVTKEPSASSVAPHFDAFRRCFASVDDPTKGGDFGIDLLIPAAGGKPEKLTRQQAFYDDIAYSPTGARIVAARAPREQRAILNEHLNPSLIITDLVWIPANGGVATLIAPLTNADRPHFSSDTTRVWVYDDEDGLVSMRWDGTDRKAHLIVTGFLQPGAGPNARPRRAT